MVPHVTDVIQNWIDRVAHIPVDGTKQVPDVCLIELGGTVGDIESMVYLEALRQLQYRVGSDNFCLVHVSLVPVVGVGEQKSKPTQHGIRELRAAGLNPDLIACRSVEPLENSAVEKISHYSMISSDNVISIYNVSNIYRVPLILLEQRVPSLILSRLKINKMPPKDIPKWRSLANRLDTTKRTVTIAIVGKYTGLTDSYLSIIHALRHAAMEIHVGMEIEWIDAEHLEPLSTDRKEIVNSKNAPAATNQTMAAAAAAAAAATAAASKETTATALEAKNPHATLHEQQSSTRDELAAIAWKKIRAADGMLVPGGFGDRGVEGMILAVQWARTHQKPFLGICLGMQVAVIEWCRSVLGLKNAHSTEFDKPTPNPVIVEMPEIDQINLGGTMRLGSRRTNIVPDTLAASLYAQKPYTWERHRHRYEVNPDYVAALQKSGMIFSGVAQPQNAQDINLRMEMVELCRSIKNPSNDLSVDEKAATKSINNTTTATLNPAAAAAVATTGTTAAATTNATAAAAAASNIKIAAFAATATAAMHPFFFGVQFHPEFLSRPLEPSPPFRGFVRASSDCKAAKATKSMGWEAEVANAVTSFGGFTMGADDPKVRAIGKPVSGAL